MCIEYEGLKLKTGNKIFLNIRIFNCDLAIIKRIHDLPSGRIILTILTKNNSQSVMLLKDIDIERTKNYRLKQKIKILKNYEYKINK